ncbi:MULTISPECIES: GNAT family N-acetyltransferase [Bradyrhizobium]|nr:MULTISPECIES: GNAT family N-acetyltransferase [Bradyrhizobium]
MAWIPNQQRRLRQGKSKMNTALAARQAHQPWCSLTTNALALSATESAAIAFLLPLSRDYPEIESWFRLKVVPGLRAGTRTLICVERQASLVAVGIAKHEVDERKICTVRVMPAYFGRGIGLRLFDSLLRWLDTDQPHLTVSDSKLPAFERIFERYGFRHTSSHMNLYVPGATELSYNDVAKVSSRR